MTQHQICKHQGLPLDTVLHYTKYPHPADAEEILGKEESMDYTLEVYTDGSKGDSGIGAGIAIFKQHGIIDQLQYKLHDRYSNNHAEQIAIFKALEAVKSFNSLEGRPKTAIIYTDSRITIDSLLNTTSHGNIIDNFRQQTRELTAQNWTIHYSWVKAHVGNFGNELADNIAKSAARNTNLQHCYGRIPESDVLRSLQEESLLQWEREWQATTKGEMTKSYFQKISLSLEYLLQGT